MICIRKTFIETRENKNSFNYCIKNKGEQNLTEWNKIMSKNENEHKILILTRQADCKHSKASIQSHRMTKHRYPSTISLHPPLPTPGTSIPSRWGTSARGSWMWRAVQQLPVRQWPCFEGCRASEKSGAWETKSDRAGPRLLGSCPWTLWWHHC